VICLAARPVVDGLRREFAGRALVLRVNYQTGVGHTLGRRYGVDVVPSFVVFDASGRVVARHVGTARVPTAALRRELERG